MTHRTTRIRHYLAGIVAACSLGGLLLAFELAYLFQSFEERSNEVGARAGHLQELSDVERRTLDWIGEVSVALGDRGRTQELGDSFQSLRLELERVTHHPRFVVPEPLMQELDVALTLSPEGLEQALEVKPESGFYAERIDQVRTGLTELGPILRARFADIATVLSSELDSVGGELAARRANLWRTITLSALAYAGLVLLLWRFTVARLIRPLQALTR